MRSLAWIAFGTLTSLVVAACMGEDAVLSPRPEPTPDGGTLTDGGAASQQKITITVKDPVVSMLAGRSTKIEVLVDREGFTGPVAVSLVKAPVGAGAKEVAIAAGERSAELVIQSAGDTKTGVTVSEIVARAVDGTASARVPLDLVIRGAPGVPDGSFGENGIVSQSALGFEIADVVARGRHVFVGGATEPPSGGRDRLWMCARLNDDGKLDASFGNQGRASGPKMAPMTGAAVIHIAASERGDVYLAGHTGTAASLMRIDKDGFVDEKFGGSLPNLRSSVSRVYADKEGLVLVGRAEFTIGGSVILARFNDTGLDTTFGMGGVANSATYMIGNRAAALAPDGKVVVGAFTGAVGSSSTAAAVLRLLPSGAKDPSFATDGLYTTGNTAATREAVEAVVAYPDGSVVAGGNNGTDAILFKLDAKGAPSATPVYTPMVYPGGASSISRAALSPDGNVIALVRGGSTVFLERFNPNLARFSLTGTPAPLDLKESDPRGLAIDAYGRAVVTTGTSVRRFWL